LASTVTSLCRFNLLGFLANSTGREAGAGQLQLQGPARYLEWTAANIAHFAGDPVNVTAGRRLLMHTQPSFNSTTTRTCPPRNT
jgi:hypothetical protein